MGMFVDGAVPMLMSAPLASMVGGMQARRAIEPAVKHDFSATLGKQVQIDRFVPLAQNGMTKAARSRSKGQIIGTANSESNEKTTRIVTLTEFTGPSTATGEPSTLHITSEDMLYARNRLWQFGMTAFHESIGSMALAVDFARFDDAALIEELLRGAYKLNPGSKTDANVLAADQFSRTDLLRLRETLSTLNTPRFPDGTYHFLVSERLWRHMCEDDKFYSFALAQIQGSNPMATSPIVYSQNSIPQVATGMGPMPIAQEAVRVVYEGFTFFPSNTIPTRAVSTSGGTRTAYLGFAFGPGTVGLASGGMGPRVALNSQTDFDRHFYFIWKMFGQYAYMLDDTADSGVSVEVRTYNS